MRVRQNTINLECKECHMRGGISWANPRAGSSTIWVDRTSWNPCIWSWDIHLIHWLNQEWSTHSVLWSLRCWKVWGEHYWCPWGVQVTPCSTCCNIHGGMTWTCRDPQEVRGHSWNQASSPHRWSLGLKLLGYELMHDRKWHRHTCGPNIEGGLVKSIIVLSQLLMSSKKTMLDAQINAGW